MIHGSLFNVEMMVFSSGARVISPPSWSGYCPDHGFGAAGRFGSVLKIRPPLCFSTVHADQLIAVLDDVLTEVS